MMDYTAFFDYRDGEGEIGPYELSSALLYERLCDDEFGPAVNYCRITFPFDAEVLSKRSATTGDIYCRILADSNPYFYGRIAPTDKFTSNGVALDGAADVSDFDIEVEDFSTLLDRDITSDDEIYWENCYVCNPALPNRSIFHKLVALCGLPRGAITIEEAELTILRAFAVDDGTVAEVLKELLYGYGLVRRFNTAGEITLFHWLIENPVSGMDLDEDILMTGLECERVARDADAAEVTWYALKSKSDALVYMADLPFGDDGLRSGYPIQPGLLWPEEANVNETWWDYQDSSLAKIVVGSRTVKKADYTQMVLTKNHRIDARFDDGIELAFTPIYQNKRAKIAYKNPSDIVIVFATVLSAAEEIQFQRWGAENEAAIGRNFADDAESLDYDMKGFFKKYIITGQDAWIRGIGDHFTDEFKKTNHPTFSTESIFSNELTPGGVWTIDDGQDVFTPSWYNIAAYGLEDLETYFTNYESESRLVINYTQAEADALKATADENYGQSLNIYYCNIYADVVYCGSKNTVTKSNIANPKKTATYDAKYVHNEISATRLACALADGYTKGRWRYSFDSETKIPLGLIGRLRDPYSGMTTTVLVIERVHDTADDIYQYKAISITSIVISSIARRNTVLLTPQANDPERLTGVNGTRTASIELYKWASSAPTTFPSGDSVYTWADGSFTAPATMRGWTHVPGTGAAGQTLYGCRQVFADSLSSATSSITWTATSCYPLGAAGSNGQRTAILEVYQWAAAAPTSFPSGTSTYTWATGIFTAPGTSNGWGINPGAAVPGQTLWACRIALSDTGTSATSLATWNASTVYAVGAAGADAIVYEIVPATLVINKSVSGTFTPATVLFSFYKTIGSTRSAFNGYYKVYISTNGSTFTLGETASGATSFTYTPSSTIKAVRVELYADSEFTNLVAQQTALIVSDGATGATGATGPAGAAGAAGPVGSNGLTTYFHVAYANSANGSTGFNQSSGPYIGTYVDNTQADSSDYRSYTWRQFVGSQGLQGNQGIQGTTGANGITYYLHIAYATSANGSSGFSTTDSTGKTYLGQCVDTSVTDPETPASYSWTLIQGPQGVQGIQGIQGTQGVTGTSQYFHVRYSTNADGAGFGTTVSTYIGTAVTSSATAPTDKSGYTWTRFIGDNGSQGIQGPTGANGTTYYLHIAYATAADGATGFSTSVSAGKTYLGQCVDTNSADPETPTSYAWTLIQGPAGTNGTNGTNGVDSPRCRGLYPYNTNPASLISGDLVVWYSATQSERGIYAWSGSTFVKQTSPTTDQVTRCFLYILTAISSISRLDTPGNTITSAYGVSSDYAIGSTSFAVIMANLILAQEIVVTGSLSLIGGAYISGYVISTSTPFKEITAGSSGTLFVVKRPMTCLLRNSAQYTTYLYLKYNNANYLMGSASGANPMALTLGPGNYQLITDSGTAYLDVIGVFGEVEVSQAAQGRSIV